MDKSSINEASLIDAGVNKSERAPGNTKVIQNNSSSYNFVSLNIKKASNNVDRNNLKIFNSYRQSCKFITILIIKFYIIHNYVHVLFLCQSQVKYEFLNFKKFKCK